jgi:hypothetical protein
MAMTVMFKETDYISNGKAEMVRETVVLDLPIPAQDDSSLTLNIVPSIETSSSSRDRLSALQKLVELSRDDASLDWGLLARVNVEAWGAEVDSE